MEKELSELEHGISELKKEISKLMTKPLYEHDCDLCVFLGSYKEHDLYYHQYKDRPLTVVARYSNYGPDYISGMCFATKGKNNSVPVLYEAKKRAIKHEANK